MPEEDDDVVSEAAATAGLSRDSKSWESSKAAPLSDLPELCDSPCEVSLESLLVDLSDEVDDPFLSRSCEAREAGALSLSLAAAAASSKASSSNFLAAAPSLAAHR
jgi:hypothetical protein